MAKINIEENMTFILEIKIMAIRWLYHHSLNVSDKRIEQNKTDSHSHSVYSDTKSDNENRATKWKELHLFLHSMALLARTMSEICSLVASMCLLVRHVLAEILFLSLILIIHLWRMDAFLSLKWRLKKMVITSGNAMWRTSVSLWCDKTVSMSAAQHIPVE